MKNTKKFFVTVVVLLVALGGIVYYAVKTPQGEEVSLPNENGENQEGAVVGKGNATGTPIEDDNALLKVKAQEGGKSVSVESAILQQDGFIAILENLDGPHLSAVGPFPKGEVKNIAFSASLIPGKTYSAVLYADNGDKNLNPLDGDVLMKDENGDPITAKFSVAE